MRLETTTLLALACAAACSSAGPAPSATSTDAGDAGDAGDGSRSYGLCTPGDGSLPPCPTCECAGGVWQPVTCPTALPSAGAVCSPEGAYCGFTTETNPCGAANCYCQQGTWSCGPTCVFEAGASPD